ncbi:hypothetical protein PAXINDRAFT_21889 [Paxillus involutus ATCC 200175]|uniref:Uncharacterized protein n=1 Tax=Paxillus involutus ATCC 200175 TaxID=664439 RepID=A0A0C9T066_PAXIN|nr:hypothetical protein PAXINDRAFT_21889 [Paxillus involutus ATCC 200175]
MSSHSIGKESVDDHYVPTFNIRSPPTPTPQVHPYQSRTYGTIGHARLRSGVFVRIALDPPRWRRLYPQFGSRFCNFVGFERVVSL